MSLGLQGIVRNITDGFGLTKQDSSKNYPEADSKRVTNAPEYSSGNWRKSQGYSFDVVRITFKEENEVIIRKGWNAFNLQINPQELTQDEVFAIEVTPTFRGVLVEHHGVTLKDITISGTTGVSPNRREGGAFKRTGTPVLASGHSGFKEFHELRSYFRVYAEEKRKDNKEGGELRMIFRNFKDEEAIYVEPQKFTMKRSATKPFMYDYTILLKGIGVATPIPPDDDALGIFGKIGKALEDATDILDTSTQVIEGSVGLIARTERDIERTILGPLRSLNFALSAIAAGGSILFGEHGITSRFIRNLKNEVNRISLNFSDAVGIDLTTYNGFSDRTSTLTAASGRSPTFEESQVINSFTNLQRGMAILLAQPDFFSKDTDQASIDVETEYSNAIQLLRPNSSRRVRILGDDTIQSLASRELLDPDRYREIVIMNNLKPPYIDDAGGEGVLQPGDNIFIPMTRSSPVIGSRKSREYNITANLSELEKNLGVDIRLDKSNDIAISNIGDVDLIAGMTNMIQAIAIRLLLESGSLKRHPGIGTDLQIGRKTTTKLLNDLRTQIIASIGSDSRVSGVPFLEVSQVGGETVINGYVKLRDSDQPLPLPITLSPGA